MYFYKANGSALIHSDTHTANKHVILDYANFELLFFLNPVIKMSKYILVKSKVK